MDKSEVWTLGEVLGFAAEWLQADRVGAGWIPVGKGGLGVYGESLECYWGGVLGFALGWGVGVALSSG